MSNKNLAEITAPEAIKNLHFIKDSKAAANAHEWLYHCTSVEALLNIINSREMWLSNLKDVNDTEEANRIDMPEFEKAYYIASFTYDPNIPEEHWGEYGKSEESVLFGVRKEWFTNKQYFLGADHKKESEGGFQIVNSFDSAVKCKMPSKERAAYDPYFIVDHGFYQVVYDDALIKKMKSVGSLNTDNKPPYGAVITVELPGIIKSTHGISKREGQIARDKNWESEKEVRLKIGVKTLNPVLKQLGIYWKQMAVKLSDTAFSELPLRFSPDMGAEQKRQSMEKIRAALPDSYIYEI